MGLQTTTSANPTKWVAGTVPESGPWVIRNFRNGASDVIMPGSAVRADGTSGTDCQAGEATNITAQTFLGVAVLDRTDSASAAGYAEGDMVPVMMFGPVVIEASEAIDASTAVTGVHLTDAGDSDTWGDGGGIVLGLGAAGNERPVAAARHNIANGALGIIDIRTFGETHY